MAATVLIVEDEIKIRELLRSYFEAEGLEVLSTASGAEAIGFARTASPDLIVLDLRLPDVPGESVAAEVRRFSSVPLPLHDRPIRCPHARTRHCSPVRSLANECRRPASPSRGTGVSVRVDPDNHLTRADHDQPGRTPSL